MICTHEVISLPISGLEVDVSISSVRWALPDRYDYLRGCDGWFSHSLLEPELTGRLLKGLNECSMPDLSLCEGSHSKGRKKRNMLVFLGPKGGYSICWQYWVSEKGLQKSSSSSDLLLEEEIGILTGEVATCSRSWISYESELGRGPWSPHLPIWRGVLRQMVVAKCMTLLWALL